MKLVDMKRPKKSRKELRAETMPENLGEQERYPWGLRLSFGKDEIEKITSLQKISAGAQVKITAMGKVLEVRIADVEKGRKRHNVEIQIQKIGIMDKSKTAEDYFEEGLKSE